MDLENDRDLFWITKEGMKAPLLASWKPEQTEDKTEILYFNFETGERVWDHPCNEHYRKMFEEHKKRKTGNATSNTGSDNEKKRTADKEETQQNSLIPPSMPSGNIFLEEHVDPNCEPTGKEVEEYAEWLGMDLENDRDLFWIAKEGMKAPL